MPGLERAYESVDMFTDDSLCRIEGYIIDVQLLSTACACCHVRGQTNETGNVIK